MSTDISPKEVTDHIENVISLLKSLKYTPQATVLTTHERKKLWDLFYTYDNFGHSNYKFGDYYYFKSQEDVENLNQKVFKSADEETRAIISKCGVDAKKVFSIINESCDIDEALSDSMYQYSIAKIGEYTIKFTRDHPISRESPELETLLQQKKFDEFKDGEAMFKVVREVDGKAIYTHIESMHDSGYISFMDTQIGGDFGIGGLSFSFNDGMMMMDVGLSKCINELMIFFDSFEKLLSQV